MPVQTIPIFSPLTQRGPVSRAAFSASKDAMLVNCLLTSIEDGLSQKRSIYVEKRQGLETYSTPSSGNAGATVFSSPSTGSVISVFLISSTYTVYADTTNAGTLSAVPRTSVPIDECIFNGVTLIFFATNDGAAWFIPNDALSVSTSFTGNRTSGSAVITGVSSISGLYVGQAISGTGIQAATRIASIDSATQITMTLTATSGSGTGTTFTREHIAKIISANFPTNCRGLVEMDGYIFAADGNNQRIYNSNINSIVNWNASDYITANIFTDALQAIVKIGGVIAGLGNTSIEFFKNQGGSFGSPLISLRDAAKRIGGASVCWANERVFFKGPTVSNPGIWELSGAQPKKISSPPVDRAISNIGIFSTIFSAYFYGGYTWLMGDYAADTTKNFLYCVELDTWTIHSFPNSLGAASNQRSVGNASYPLFVDSSTDGKVFTWSATPTYQDKGSAFTMTIQTQPFVLNKGSPFVVKRFRLIGDNQSGGTIGLRVNDKDYNSSNWRTVGSFDKTDLSQWLGRGGYFRNHMIIELTDSHNSACRLQAIEVDWEPCS